MPTLEALVQQVVAATAEAQPDPQEMFGSLQAIAQATERATPEARTETLRRLLTAMEHEHPQIAGFVAITAGAIVEQGASPHILAPSLLRRLSLILQNAARFVDACRATLPEPSDEDSDEEEGDEDDVLWIDGRRMEPDAVKAITETDFEGFVAFQSLEYWCMPAIACLSQDVAIRDEARRQPELRISAGKLDGNSGPASFLYKMLQVLDDEPLLVLHPETGKGFRCRFGGVSDNFQLHTLLMDTLIAPEPAKGLLARFRKSDSVSGGPLSGTRPHPVAVAVAKGEGPQESNAPSVGAWNLWNWTALRPDGTLPAPMEESKHWIWGEGIPSDIAPFEGLRVAVLGPPAYQRSWNTCRLFGNLKAYLQIEETLSPTQATEWMRRLGNAEKPRVCSHLIRIQEFLKRANHWSHMRAAARWTPDRKLRAVFSKRVAIPR